MSRRRLIPLVLGVVALLAVVAVAAHGRPLGSGGAGGSSGGPSPTFWSYVFTTLLIIELLAFIGAAWVAWVLRPDVGSRKVGPGGTVRALAILIAIIATVFFVRLHFAHKNAAPTPPPIHHVQPGSQQKPSTRKHGRKAEQFQWPELAVVLALLAAGGAVYVVRRKRLGSRARRPLFGSAPETLAASLDESLDDLRADPDLRRAIVAAYARMERTLASVGLPRHPAEAPLEYVERALLSLDVGAGPVRRLTDLFEWARFSHHEPEPAMRDEAVDALVAIRDDLRAAEPVAA